GRTRIGLDRHPIDTFLENYRKTSVRIQWVMQQVVVVIKPVRMFVSPGLKDFVSRLQPMNGKGDSLDGTKGHFFPPLSNFGGNFTLPRTHSTVQKDGIRGILQQFVARLATSHYGKLFDFFGFPL
ncbi:hypothetical protein HAX54_002551, partial [Datura stramonium]|nr:hypothetical protein [Datura stramonium]